MRYLTKIIWWWERNRPYPVRQCIFKLPTLPCRSDSEVTLAVLTSVANWPDACWAAYSLLHGVETPLRVEFCVDGEVTDTMLAQASQLLGGAELIGAANMIERIPPSMPNLRAYASVNACGRKLALNYLAQQRGPLLYSDSDVLAFRPLTEIDEAIRENKPFYIPDIDRVNPDPMLLQTFHDENVPYCENLNAGFFFTPQDTLHADRIEHFLAPGKHNPESWFSEQTLMAMFMQANAGHKADGDDYVVSAQRQFYFENDVDYGSIKLRHFIQPVRHLMYSRGMPQLWKQWRNG